MDPLAVLAYGAEQAPPGTGTRNMASTVMYCWLFSAVSTMDICIRQLRQTALLTAANHITTTLL